MTDTRTMVERVAQAIARADLRTWEQLSDLVRDDFRAEARAAIEAMRVPTPGMIQAAETHRYNIEETVAQFYRVMIKAALAEGKP
jgi:hypothetical protein